MIDSIENVDIGDCKND